MADTQNDLIRWAAGYRGWESDGSNTYMDSDYQTARCPHDDRGDFHALVGLVEDKMREEIGFSITTYMHGATIVYRRINAIEDDHKDPLIARLGALKQLVEKVDG